VNAIGELRIVLYHVNGKADAVEVVSARPDASRVLLGKTPEQVLTIIPLLFSICAHAQSYAALTACRTALGLSKEPELDAAHLMLVELETLREHVWRILLDWSGFISLQADKKSLAEFIKLAVRLKRILFRHGQGFKPDSRLEIDRQALIGFGAELEAFIDLTVFKGGLSDFRQIENEEQLLAWLRGNRSVPALFMSYLYHRQWWAVGNSAIDCLPALDGVSFGRHLQQHDLRSYSQAPHWQGRCFETTVLNRFVSQPLILQLRSRYQNGILVRILARLLEVCRISSCLHLWADDFHNSADLNLDCEFGVGIGIGQVQAARGLLIHRLELYQGLVKDYCIIAPTEWNFHPQGVVEAGLKSLRAENETELRRQAELLINLIDPCVQYDLILANSEKAPEVHA
jgi:hypothetical protein